MREFMRGFMFVRPLPKPLQSTKKPSSVYKILTIVERSSGVEYLIPPRFHCSTERYHYATYGRKVCYEREYGATLWLSFLFVSCFSVFSYSLFLLFLPLSISLSRLSSLTFLPLTTYISFQAFISSLLLFFAYSFFLLITFTLLRNSHSFSQALCSLISSPLQVTQRNFQGVAVDGDFDQDVYGKWMK